jgi:hypothetical protein
MRARRRWHRAPDRVFHLTVPRGGRERRSSSCQQRVRARPEASQS